MRIITESSWGEQFPHSVTIEVNGHRRLYVDADNANARYALAFEQGRQSAPTSENVECPTCGRPIFKADDPLCSMHMAVMEATSENVECPICGGCGHNRAAEHRRQRCPDCTPENVEEPT